MPIDPSIFNDLTISDEERARIESAIESYADSARTRASETAIKNRDRKYQTELAAAIENAKAEALAEAQMTADQKLKAQEERLEAERVAFEIDRAKLKAETMLLGKGYTPEQVEQLMPVLDAAKDGAAIPAIVDGLITAMESVVTGKVDAVKQDLLGGATHGDGGAEGGQVISTTATLQAQIDQALADGNTPLATSLTRQMAESQSE